MLRSIPFLLSMRKGEKELALKHQVKHCSQYQSLVLCIVKCRIAPPSLLASHRSHFYFLIGPNCVANVIGGECRRNGRWVTVIPHSHAKNAILHNALRVSNCWQCRVRNGRSLNPLISTRVTSYRWCSFLDGNSRILSGRRCIANTISCDYRLIDRDCIRAF